MQKKKKLYCSHLIILLAIQIIYWEIEKEHPVYKNDATRFVIYICLFITDK